MPVASEAGALTAAGDLGVGGGGCLLARAAEAGVALTTTRRLPVGGVSRFLKYTVQIQRKSPLSDHIGSAWAVWS